MEKIGKDATIAAARKGVQKNIVRKNVTNKALGAGAGIAGYTAAGAAYGSTFDYVVRKQEEANLKILNQKLGLTN